MLHTLTTEQIEDEFTPIIYELATRMDIPALRVLIYKWLEDAINDVEADK